MQTVKDDMETIHLYVVRDEPKEKRPYTAFPLFCAFLCLLGIAAVTWYSALHPYYEHRRITVPAIFLPLKVFKAEAPIISTGIKTYPATYAHGYLTFSNGSVIGQSVPAGFTIDGAMTDYAIYVPAATANGFGIVTVPAHLLTSGVNKSTLAINEVIGASLFIRNLSPFTGGHPAYSVTYQKPIDRVNALSSARSSVATLKTHIVGFLAQPCKESAMLRAVSVKLSWGCQYVTFTVPKYMHISSAKFAGNNFIVDVWFTPLYRPIGTFRK